jgi:plastocyanin
MTQRIHHGTLSSFVRIIAAALLIAAGFSLQHRPAASHALLAPETQLHDVVARPASAMQPLASPPAALRSRFAMAQASDVVTVTVGAGGLRFSPADVVVPLGGTVRWIWEADFHTVTSGSSGLADGKFCSPNDHSCAQPVASNTGTVYEHTFTQAGVYSYYCAFHWAAGMTGAVTVTGPLTVTSQAFFPIILSGWPVAPP